MIKFSQFIEEQKQLTEAFTNPYKVERGHFRGGSGFEFTTDDDRKFFIKVDDGKHVVGGQTVRAKGYEFIEIQTISTPGKKKGSKTINVRVHASPSDRGDQFRILATVLSVIKKENETADVVIWAARPNSPEERLYRKLTEKLWPFSKWDRFFRRVGPGYHTYNQYFFWRRKLGKDFGDALEQTLADKSAGSWRYGPDKLYDD